MVEITTAERVILLDDSLGDIQVYLDTETFAYVLGISTNVGRVAKELDADKALQLALVLIRVVGQKRRIVRPPPAAQPVVGPRPEDMEGIDASADPTGQPDGGAGLEPIELYSPRRPGEGYGVGPRQLGLERHPGRERIEQFAEQRQQHQRALDNAPDNRKGAADDDGGGTGDGESGLRRSEGG